MTASRRTKRDFMSGSYLVRVQGKVKLAGAGVAMSGCQPLLVAKRRRGLHSRGSDGGIEATDSTDDGRKHDSENYRIRRDFNSNCASDRGEEVEEFACCKGEQDSKYPSGDSEK